MKLEEFIDKIQDSICPEKNESITLDVDANVYIDSRDDICIVDPNCSTAYKESSIKFHIEIFKRY